MEALNVTPPSAVRPAATNQSGAARYLGVAEGTLEKMRWLGTGPVFIRRPNGRGILYLFADLDDWLRRGRRRSTSDSGPIE